MLVQRTDPKSYPLTLESKGEYYTFYYWCDDGWLYIPEKKLRRKFFTTQVQNQFEMVQEPREGIVPLPEHSEWVQVSLYSESPRIWQVQTDELCELYVELPASQSKSKKSRDRQADPQ